MKLVMPGPVPGIHVFLGAAKTWMAGTSPAMTKNDCEFSDFGTYAVAMSGNTASILVFSVAALNGLTM
jgi:hydroxyethylthiazole kinase-like sugar kinase family protein